MANPVYPFIGVGQSEVTVKAIVTSVLDRTKVLRAWCRWLDEEAWGGFGPRTISVGFAVFDKASGNLLEQGEAHAPGFDPAPISTETDEVRLGWDESGRHLDGNIRMIDVKRNPITGLECLWKR